VSLAGEATWNYFVAPFIFTRPNFTVDEREPWREDGQVWRRLVVTYPDSIVAHPRQQTYCFDEHGLIRGLDYTVYQHRPKATHFQRLKTDPPLGCHRHEAW